MFLTIEKVKKKFNNKIITLCYKYFPLNPKSNDVYLVSFPRSGSTWIRFFLANLIVINKDIQVDFNSMDYIIPPLHKIYSIKYRNRPKKIPRIMRSHSIYNKKYNKVIYLVRDPRDVMISYYNYSKYIQDDKSIKSLRNFIINDKNRGIEAWKKHVNSWKGKVGLLIRYEDLKRNPYPLFKKMCDFIEFPNDLYKNINLAINKSSFKNMKNIEEKFGNPYVLNKKYRFVRKGKIGEWQYYFDSDLRFKVENVIGSELEFFGYNDI